MNRFSSPGIHQPERARELAANRKPADRRSAGQAQIIGRMRFSPRAMGLLAAVVTVAIWTGFIVIARGSAQRTLTALDLALLRIVGASLVLLPWSWWLVRRRGAGAAGRRQASDQSVPGQSAPNPPTSSLFGLSPLPLRTTALLGLFGGPLYALLIYAGFFYAPATHAAVLMPGSLPLWTALLAAWLLRERIGARRAAGLALIVCGGLLVGGRSLLAGFSGADSGGAAGAAVGGEVWKGDLLFLLAVWSWAGYGVLARRHAVDAVQATVAVTAFAFLGFVPGYALALALGAPHSRLAAAPWSEIVFQMLFQGLFAVVLAGISYTRMIGHFGPVRSTMITALVPGLAALGAVVFLREAMHWSLAAGLLLASTGIVLGVQRPGRGRAAAPVCAVRRCAADAG